MARMVGSQWAVAFRVPSVREAGMAQERRRDSVLA